VSSNSPELPSSLPSAKTPRRKSAGPKGRRGKEGARKAPRRPVVPAGLNGDAATARGRLADYLKLMAWWLGRPPTPALSPRLERTLRGLLQGQSEKQIAMELDVSVHTVHEYVKELHRRLGVNSRGELLARFLPTRPALPKA
jgi:DNA-binding CsgD family transcriptional regulator